MIKILHLYPKIDLACGISKSIYSIVTNTKEMSESYVYCLGGDSISKFERAEIKIIVHSVKKRTLLSSILIFFDLLSLVKSKEINIVHSHHRYFDLIVFIISKLISVRTITSVQSKVYGKKSLSYKSEVLIPCSYAIKRHLIDYFVVKENRIKVIHNFIDPLTLKLTVDKSTLKKEMGIQEIEIVIGFIGRFNNQEKGIDILLEAFRRISGEFSNRKLVLIGEGDDKKYITNFIDKYHLNAITLTPKENIFDYYNIIDIVVLPSRVEPFGIVAIEAGLMKKAFIGSNVDGLKEIITNGADGILSEKENVDSLAQNLKKLIENPELRTSLGEALYQKVINNFTSEQDHSSFRANL